MDAQGLLAALAGDYTFRSVALGAGLLGAVNGALGCFAVLRRRSLLGDAVSHAALPGIVLAWLLTGSRATPLLLLGAALAGWAATLAVGGIVRNSRVKEDASLGLVLSVFFGAGLVLLTFVQKMPDASQAGLDRFLFGQAATLVRGDVWTIGAAGGAVLLLVVLFWKEFKVLSFDPDYAASLGLPARGLDLLLTTLLVASISLGLTAVGVVLMSAMVVAPPAAARQWTDRLGVMVALAAAFGALSGVGGALASSAVPRLPAGPSIVVLASGVVFASLLFAPNRGLLWGWARERRNRRRLATDAVLEDLYVLARQHPGEARGHSIRVLRAMSLGHGGADRSLAVLEERGLVRRTEDGGWTLTPEGLAEATRRAVPEGEPR